MNKQDFNKNWVVTFDPSDDLPTKLRKAANVKPHPAQLAWMEREFTAFVHYGPNTFTGRQWGNGKESKDDFAPTDLDVKQWCKICAEAGIKMMLYTIKHHDGFCQWFTESTDFSVKHGIAKVDIMQSLREGCDEYGLELGIYLSPWDMYQREEGLWWTKEYNDYFLLQLRELLTNYGKIKEVWFDGACGDSEIWKKVSVYQPQTWYDLIEELQPMAVIRLYDPYSFADEATWQRIKDGMDTLEWSGKGVRWVGNEIGKSRPNEWSVQPVFDRVIAESQTWNDLGEESYYQNAVGAIWYPLEVNTVVLNQWFWNPDTSTTRTITDLVQVYYNSIGNNGALLLNVSPDRKGLLTPEQCVRLGQLRAYIDETFTQNFALGATVTATITAAEESTSHPLVNVLNENGNYWTTESWNLGNSQASLLFELEKAYTFDNVLIQEFIQEGQRVAGWTLEVWTESGWQEVVKQKTIGYKNIKQFTPITTDKVRFTISRSWDRPLIRSFGLYLSAELPQVEEMHDSLLSFTGEEVTVEHCQSGLLFACYEGGLQSAAILGSVFGLKQVGSGIVEKVNLDSVSQEIGYAVSYTGYLKVETEDEYTLTLDSADGSVLFIRDTLVINNDEPHARKAVKRVVHLQEGYHPIRIFYTSFRHAGEISLRWESSTFKEQEIGASYFLHVSNSKN